MAKTSIEWCDHSINPIRARLNGRTGHHCVKISAGCTNCYASKLQSRFGMPPYQANRRHDAELFLHAPALEEVRSRKKPTRYFWCDMTDMFLDEVPREWWKAINGVWLDTPQHVHMVLTKRPHTMLQYFSEDSPPPNVWAGVSIEDQATADERIPILLQTPAAVRFVSYEPALGPVDLQRIGVHDDPLRPSIRTWGMNALNGACQSLDGADYGIGAKLDWVICGGESGPGARPCDLAWIRSIKEQCQAAGVPVFVKQLGKYVCDGQPPNLHQIGWLKDKKGGDIREFPEDLRVREFPVMAGTPRE